VKLASNKELYEYLLTLSSRLKSEGDERLSQLVALASRHAAGMSTEFLGESRIALREVVAKPNNALSEKEYAQVLNVLEQLDDALDRR
jgi:hypothetical protein